jgi:hypothetical protein
MPYPDDTRQPFSSYDTDVFETRGTVTHSSLAFYPQEETDTARSSRTAKVGIYLSHEVEI